MSIGMLQRGWVAGARLAGLVIGCLPVVVGALGADAPLFGDRVVAKGPGVEVRESELDRRFLLFSAELAAEGQILPDEERSAVRRSLLEKIVHTRLLVDRATPEQRTRAEAVAGKILAEKREEAGSDRNFRRDLLVLGLDEATYRRQMLERAICEEVINDTIRSDVRVTDDEARRYYQENIDQFRQPEAALIRHLHMTDLEIDGSPLDEEDLARRRRKMEELLRRAKAGEAFSELMKELPPDPESLRASGEFVLVRGNMIPEIDAVAFALTPGQVSDLIVTRHGFHLIQMVEKRDGQRVRFDDVRARIVDHLTIRQVEERLPVHMEKLVRDAGIRMDLEGID